MTIISEADTVLFENKASTWGYISVRVIHDYIPLIYHFAENLVLFFFLSLSTNHVASIPLTLT